MILHDWLVICLESSHLPNRMHLYRHFLSDHQSLPQLKQFHEWSILGTRNAGASNYGGASWHTTLAIKLWLKCNRQSVECPLFTIHRVAEVLQMASTGGISMNLTFQTVLYLYCRSVPSTQSSGYCSCSLPKRRNVCPEHSKCITWLIALFRQA